MQEKRKMISGRWGENGTNSVSSSVEGFFRASHGFFENCILDHGGDDLKAAGEIGKLYRDTPTTKFWIW